MSREPGERRTYGGVIMAELGADDLQRFLEMCQRERRTTGFFAGRILHDWLEQHHRKGRSRERTA